jgi:hypothetical protein
MPETIKGMHALKKLGHKDQFTLKSSDLGLNGSRKLRNCQNKGLISMKSVNICTDIQNPMVY